MNKLTITDKVFVPVSVNDELPTSIIEDKKVFALENDSLFVATKIEDGFKLKDEREYSHLEYEATHWLKEETNKYVLSREEMEQVIMKAVEMAREGIVVNRISEWETEKEFDYNDSQIINLIL
jgi:hypothetical protein